MANSIDPELEKTIDKFFEFCDENSIFSSLDLACELVRDFIGHGSEFEIDLVEIVDVDSDPISLTTSVFLGHDIAVGGWGPSLFENPVVVDRDPTRSANLETAFLEWNNLVPILNQNALLDSYQDAHHFLESWKGNPDVTIFSITDMPINQYKIVKLYLTFCYRT